MARVTIKTAGVGKGKAPGRNRAFADPPRPSANDNPSGGSAQWLNQTGGVATLWFPNADQVFSPPPGGFTFPTEIPPGAAGLTFAIKAGATPGNYPYIVYCVATGSLAEGESPPSIDVP